MFHNKGFRELHINGIYKSFKIDDIGNAVLAMKTLDIKGAGISMPFKIRCLKYIDYQSAEVNIIEAANTLVHHNGKITAYNTDYLAAKSFIANLTFDGVLNILGQGGYSRAVQYACRQLNKKYDIFNRDNWDDLHSLKDSVIFNCTPMNEEWVNPPPSCMYIDCLASTETGQALSDLQAKAQFKIYTEHDYPL